MAVRERCSAAINEACTSADGGDSRRGVPTTFAVQHPCPSKLSHCVSGVAAYR